MIGKFFLFMIVCLCKYILNSFVIIMNSSTKNGLFYKLLDNDFFVFSAHKTATQSVVNSIKNSGFGAVHLHVLRHVDFEEGDFKDFVDFYYREKKKPLKIISIFREPISRMISSFFQTHGDDMVKFGIISSIEESILFDHSVLQLQEIFIQHLRDRTLHGYDQSLDIICNELGVDVNGLSFDAEKMIGVNLSEKYQLFLMRFDLLLSNFDQVLKNTLGQDVGVSIHNLSKEKWYSDIYSRFKRDVKIPRDVIEDIYEERAELINLFYSDEAEKLLSNTLNRYSF